MILAQTMSHNIRNHTIEWLPPNVNNNEQTSYWAATFYYRPLVRWIEI